MEKLMESHGIWRAQKNTNPVNYMCSVVLIITGKDLPIPNSRVQNVSCWNGNSEDLDDRDPSFSEDLDQPLQYPK